MNINFRNFFNSLNSIISKRGSPNTDSELISSETGSIIRALSRGLTPMMQMQEFEQSLEHLLKAHNLIDLFDLAENSITYNAKEPADENSQVDYIDLLSFILNIADYERDKNWPVLGNPSKDIENLAIDTMNHVAQYDQTEGILLSKTFRDDILKIIKEHHNLFGQTNTGQEINQLAEEILSKAEDQAMKNDLERNTIEYIYEKIKNLKSGYFLRPFYGELIVVDKYGNPPKDNPSLPNDGP